MTINEYFKLEKSQFELDFVDIDVSTDTPLFLDPYFISLQKSDFAYKCDESIKNYFGTLMNAIETGNLTYAEELLAKTNEINDVHLGLSKGISAGRGIGKSNSQDFIKALKENESIILGLVDNLEDVGVLINGIGKDKISDLCANILREHLIDYTINQCELWGINLVDKVPSGWFWNSTTSEWTNEYKRRLIIDGNPCLLVPKEIVSYAEQYTTEKYKRHFVLNFMQNEHLRMNSLLVKTRYNKDGTIKDKYVTKKSIENYQLEIGDPINKEFIKNYSIKNKELFTKFQEHKHENYKDPFSLDNHLDFAKVVASNLINEIKILPSGADNSTEYEKLILGVSELVFYPSLLNPKPQTRIHSGRKIIDIVFSNRAEKGVFKRLYEVNKINVPFVLMECKNYSKDITNPELDQMIGRFGQHRGSFGIIFCRSLINEKLFIERERDTLKDNNHLIIHLTDNDVISLLQSVIEIGMNSFEELISKKCEEVLLG
jgi:hypothetical protein